MADTYTHKGWNCTQCGQRLKESVYIEACPDCSPAPRKPVSCQSCASLRAQLAQAEAVLDRRERELTGHIDTLAKRAEQAEAERDKWRRIRTPTHGPCCTCQACGQFYDDCRCDLDDVADSLKRAEAERDAALQRAKQAEEDGDESAVFLSGANDELFAVKQRNKALAQGLAEAEQASIDKANSYVLNSTPKAREAAEYWRGRAAAFREVRGLFAEDVLVPGAVSSCEKCSGTGRVLSEAGFLWLQCTCVAPPTEPGEPHA